MTRIPLVADQAAAPKSQELLGAVKKKLGLVPNMARVLAHSPAALDAYLAMSGALAHAGLSAEKRERLALTVGEANACGYCLSAHTAIGQKLGLSLNDTLDARAAKANDPKTAATLALARTIVTTQGRVGDADLQKARAAGLTDADLVETIAVVALNIFTNYVNHIAETPIDFPEVKPGLKSCGTNDACATEAKNR